jgi:hypothetical protein
MLSSKANVIMVSSGANAIIWCYHVMLSSGMITHPFFIFPENFTHSGKTGLSWLAGPGPILHSHFWPLKVFKNSYSNFISSMILKYVMFGLTCSLWASKNHLHRL